MNTKFKIRKKVRFKTNDSSWSGCYPIKGTIGTILKVDVCLNGEYSLLVQWERGSTQGDDVYFCMDNQVDLYEKEDDFLLKE